MHAGNGSVSDIVSERTGEVARLACSSIGPSVSGGGRFEEHYSIPALVAPIGK